MLDWMGNRWNQNMADNDISTCFWCYYRCRFSSSSSFSCYCCFITLSWFPSILNWKQKENGTCWIWLFCHSLVHAVMQKWSHNAHQSESQSTQYRIEREHDINVTSSLFPHDNGLSSELLAAEIETPLPWVRTYDSLPRNLGRTYNCLVPNRPNQHLT